MEGLELVVDHRGVDHCRQRRRVCKPIQQVFDAGSQLIAGRRRNESSVRIATSSPTHDNDAVSKTTSIAELAGRPMNQSPLQLAQQAKGKRTILWPSEGALSYTLEVEDLPHLRCHALLVVAVGSQHVSKRCICSL
jgi:hypothetical protein